MARSWTTYCSIIFAMATVCPAVSPAQTKIDDDARSVIAGCHDAIKGADKAQTFDTGMCLGIIKGLHYLSRDICIPPATTLGQIANVISKYVDRHVAKTQDDFREISLQAMRSAWPCGEKQEI
jgi:hypothetical protein